MSAQVQKRAIAAAQERHARAQEQLGAGGSSDVECRTAVRDHEDMKLERFVNFDRASFKGVLRFMAPFVSLGLWEGPGTAMPCARHLSSTQNSLENARRALEAAQREVPRALFAGVSMVFPVNWSEGTWFCCRYCYICIIIIITIFIYYCNTYTIYKIWFRVSWCQCAAFQQFFGYVPWSEACHPDFRFLSNFFGMTFWRWLAGFRKTYRTYALIRAVPITTLRPPQPC